uniref:AB hydrolase-1 domain-containing protein n=1 Tax=Parastrongyloides trichosuri TaxID=131310 RepID=A0A0N4ZG60_PARTI
MLADVKNGTPVNSHNQRSYRRLSYNEPYAYPKAPDNKKKEMISIDLDRFIDNNNQDVKVNLTYLIMLLAVYGTINYAIAYVLQLHLPLYMMFNPDLFNVNSSSKPLLTLSENSKENQQENFTIHEIVQNCPILNEKYIAPFLWGKNGHLQTGAYGILGHPQLQRTYNERCFVLLDDNTTVVYDIFEPIAESIHKKNITLALCPGIANNSESNYIRTCVHYAQQHGYRIAVLNHLGSLNDVPLTSNRIFCYGGTKELKAMMLDLFKRYPDSKFINIGFSMGANITTRLLGKLSGEMLEKIICGMSVNQGYCAVRSSPYFHDWENGRRLYNYIITEKVKQILWRHYDKAIVPHVRSGLIDESKIWAASSNITLDEHYHRRVYGFKSVEEFYEWCGSLKSIPNIKIPMLFLNAEDDPIVPKQLYNLVQDICKKNNNLAHVLTKHGGHLGFLEGRSLKPNSVTWLDRFIVQFADASCLAYYSKCET